MSVEESFIGISQLSVDSFDVGFDADEIVVGGRWTRTPVVSDDIPGLAASTPFGIPRGPRRRPFPWYDEILWDLRVRVAAAGVPWVEEIVAEGVVEARASSNDPFRAMVGTQLTDPRTAADNAMPGEFVEEGDFRLAIPRSALDSIPALRLPGPASLRLRFGRLVQLIARSQPQQHVMGESVIEQRLYDERRVPFTLDLTEPTVNFFTLGVEDETSPVAIGGLVTDPGESAGLDSARIGIRDRVSGEWFDFGSNAFREGEQWRVLPLTRTNPQAARFRFEWTETPDGSQRYEAVVQVLDRGSNEHRAGRDFTVRRERPSFTIDAPLIAIGPTVPITIRIDSEFEVADVRLTISDIGLADAAFWDGSAWRAQRQQVPVPSTPAAGGAVATYDFSPPSGSTYYLLGVEVTDVAGATEYQHTNMRLLPADDTPPTTQITHPASDDQVVARGLVTLRGRVRDDFQPDAIQLRIRDRNRATDEDYWDGSGWGPAVWLPGTLVGGPPAPMPSGASADWIHDFDSALAALRGGTGDYLVVARGIDSEENVGDTARRRFSIAP